MLKKCLSIIVSILLIITSITGISLVTTYATGDIATPDIATTIFPSTFSRDIERYQLENLANNPSGGPYLPGGDIYSNPEVYDEAVAYAKEVLANPNASQEEFNYAYYNLLYINDKLIDIGWLAGPYLTGDSDFDHEVTIKDATKVQMIVSKYTTNLPEKGTVCCYSDVNFDFKINIKDVTMLQCFVAGYTDELSCGYTGQYFSISYYYNNQYEIG